MKAPIAAAIATALLLSIPVPGEAADECVTRDQQIAAIAADQTAATDIRIWRTLGGHEAQQFLASFNAEEPVSHLVADEIVLLENDGSEQLIFIPLLGGCVVQTELAWLGRNLALQWLNGAI